MGKGRDPSKQAEEHVSRPLGTLKDPSAFGPPPKNVNYHGGAALPNQLTPATSGWGAPLTQDQLSDTNKVVGGPTEEEIEEENKRAGPPLPYRADRTGLRTDHLPPPPVHRDMSRALGAEEPAPARPKPGLPPRLPSRQNTNTASTTSPVAVAPLPTTAPPAYNSLPVAQPSQQPSANYGINPAAVKRLGNAGVSVPALGIGSGQVSNPWHNEQSQSTQSNRPKSPAAASPTPVNQLSELQARFTQLNSTSSATSQQGATPPFVTPAQSPAPPTGVAVDSTQVQNQTQATPWAEKQAAMRTAQSAYKDPSSVSVQDAASAARTANSFRDRHKDTIGAAGARASGWNKKYNVTGRLNSFLEKANSPTGENPPTNALNGTGMSGQQQVVGNVQPQQTQPPSQSPELTASISRKPPPPPPPKKPANMHGNAGAGTISTDVAAPPPVPLGTKPSYS